MTRRQVFIGILLTLVILSVHLSVMGDYGLTWDFHHIFFQGLRLVGRPITPDLTENIPFGQPAPWDMYDVPFGQLMPMLSAWGYRLFHETLKVLPLDSGFHLTTVVIGSAGIFFLFLTLGEGFGFPVALTGLFILALYPRYFSEIQNNIKDVPQVTMFAVSMWLFWRFMNRRTVIMLFLSAAAFAVSFNIKINSVYIPVVAGLWVLTMLITKSGRHLKQPLTLKPLRRLLPVAVYFPLAAFLALLVWIAFWDQPFRELLYIPRFFQENTRNLEVLLGGKWYCSTVSVPWYYPFYYLGIVTPLPVLVFFAIGTGYLLAWIRRKPMASLLLAWFLVPLLRFFLPKVAVIDGIRHFEEVIYPLCAISAVGAVSLYSSFISRIRRLPKLSRELPIYGLITGLPVILFAVYLVYPVFRYHPYQLTYYNELVGGIRGANTRYDLDYWGSSQKQAVRWLNRNAPPDAGVYIVMVPDVAAKYLRPDLLEHLNKVERDRSDYVVVLNRQSFFYRYFYTVEYMLTHDPVYTVETQGVPLVWIFDNKNPRAAFKTKWWTGESPCIRKYWISIPP